tara:strand:- start:1389 stop:3767 length:2379 start_codon:yes stop_codon:yes gene_type:complete
MIISLEWLKEFVDISETLQELSVLLTNAGLEAEPVSIPESLNGVVIGKVKSAQKHPNADRLKLCSVSDGTDIHQVVCGAKNVDKGQTIVFAKPGAMLPGDFKIKKVKIRGVESCGMICSERELLISDEHEGIFILPDNLVAGQDFMEAYGHKFLSIELDLTPNRPDALSHQGIARDIAAIKGRKFNQLQIKTVKPNIDTVLSISIEDPMDCPRYIGGIVKNLKVGPSPDWMVERLKAVGQRSINNLVDISNYILLEMGHPTHIFDYDKLDRKEIFVRRAINGEKLTSLDNIEHKLNKTQLLITDGKSPIALAGVMGGLDTAVTVETKTVLVESAYFNPITIRKSAKTLQMNTDASKRFERGADPDAAERGFWRVVTLLQELADGEFASEMIDKYPLVQTQPSLSLRRSKLDLILGNHIKKEEVDHVLNSLEIESNFGSKDEWHCKPPSFRPDIEREIDIIEEIARVVGYDTLPTDENIYGTFRYYEPDPEKHIESISSTLAGMGFHQIYSNSLNNETSSNLNDKNAVKLMNPLSQEMGFLRTSLIPGLLKAADFNEKNGNSNFRLFELANIHEQETEGFEGIKEHKYLAGVIYGLENIQSVHQNPYQEDIYSIKGYLVALFKNKFGIRFELKPSDHVGYNYAQTILLNRKDAGILGRISPDWINKLDLDLKDIFAFEIKLDSIMRIISRKKKFSPINFFPKIARDLNLVMPESQPVGPLIKMIKNIGQNLVSEVRPVNIFKDKISVGKYKKSVTFSIIFQHHAKTLEDKDVNPIIDDIIGVVKKNFNAKLRS